MSRSTCAVSSDRSPVVTSTSMFGSRNKRVRISIPHWSTVGWKFPSGNAYSHTVKKLFLSVYVDGSKVAGKKQNVDPMWKVLMKQVDLGEPTSSLTTSIWFALNENVKQARILWTVITEIFLNPGSPQEQKKNYFVQGDLMQTSVHGPMIWKVVQRHVERYCELANKAPKELYKVSAPCIDDHHVKEEELGSVGELSNVWFQNVFRCL